MWEAIYWIIKAVLGFVFSGSQKTEVYRTPGVQGLDKETLAGVQDLPKFVLIIGLIFITGCIQPFIGRNTTEQLALVEAGGYVEIGQDEPIEVKYIKLGIETTELRNIACARVVPKKVYDDLVTRYEIKHPKTSSLDLSPSIELCEATIENGIIVMAEAVPTCMITSRDKITILATSSLGKVVKSRRRLTGMIAMSKTTYEQLTNDNK